jgi:hypothetical protein
MYFTQFAKFDTGQNEAKRMYGTRLLGMYITKATGKVTSVTRLKKLGKLMPEKS